MAVRAPWQGCHTLWNGLLDPHRKDSGGVKEAASLAFPDHDVVDEQGDEGALLVEGEAVPGLSGHPLGRRVVEAGVDGQLVEPSPRLREPSVDWARLIRWAP